MKHLFLIFFLFSAKSYVFAQSGMSGTTVIVAFSNYDNNGLYGQLTSETDGIISFTFYENSTPCRIDNRGNILEGEEYIKSKRPGQSIYCVQVYEAKKKIVNPDLDRNKTTGNFMFIETADGKAVFGTGDYYADRKTFVVQTKPAYKKVALTSEGGEWKVTSSDELLLSTGTLVKNLYLYLNNTRRFYTRKD